ncbi:MAG: cysteine desulfurase [Candidatus Pacebacteria bacterium]|nr:cysteine desulfurase [Candidatus Paceibacterota bacterium]
MKVYLDNAATTPVDPEVLAVMMPFFKEKFGNPSSVHYQGQEAKIALDRARVEVADFFRVEPEEIIFTSGATESVNLAHKGLIETFQKSRVPACQAEKPHIVTTSIEHKAVLETCRHLEKLGWAEVTYLPVDRFGLVRAEAVERAIKPNTVLISVMYVNNEVGTIQPIKKIGDFVKKINLSRPASGAPRIFFHTDATQAIQYLNCDVSELGIDLLSLTGHKFYAPKGVGLLLVKSGISLVRQQDGGGQDHGRRAGTENVAFIAGLAEALKQRAAGKEQEAKRVKELRDRLAEGILKKISGVVLTGHPEKRAPHIASFTIRGVEGEAVLMYLADEGIAASSGSACAAGDLNPSHVLLAMGVKPELAHGSLRFSLGKKTTIREIDYVLSVLPEIVVKLRKMAPK